MTPTSDIEPEDLTWKYVFLILIRQAIIASIAVVAISEGFNGRVVIMCILGSLAMAGVDIREAKKLKVR